jgi:hypothetical protein
MQAGELVLADALELWASFCAALALSAPLPQSAWRQPANAAFAVLRHARGDSVTRLSTGLAVAAVAASVRSCTVASRQLRERRLRYVGVIAPASHASAPGVARMRSGTVPATFARWRTVN